MGRYEADNRFVKNDKGDDVAAEYLKETICSLREGINNDF